MMQPIMQTLMERWQRPLAEWQERELPCEDKDKQILRVTVGAAEEMGEVSRCVLKRSQQIRATEHVWTSKAEEEIGDVCVYLMQLCTLLGLDFERCIERAAQKVLARRWATKEEGNTP
jgi:NTP pyrophosphatase (non-canonical NTP hydrolase)